MLRTLLGSGLSMMFSWSDVGTFLKSFLFKIGIFIDGIVFNLIDVCYQIFLVLSKARVFDDNMLSDVLQRFYVLIGVLMMFFVAYSLLKVIVKPDDLTKGDLAPGKLITNVLTSIVLIALLPTIFKYTYQIQGVLLDQDLVGRIIFGEAASDSSDTIVKGGREMAIQVWGAFFYADNGDDDSVIGSDDDTLQQAKDRFVEEGSISYGFRKFTQFSENAATGEVQYSPIVSLIAGCFCLWMIVSFIFDLGIRAVKLGVLQIIAPIPILMRVLPGKGKTFNNWIQMTLATFFEVFVRIFIVYIVAKIVGQIGTIMDGLDASVSGGIPGAIKGLSKAFLIMGIVAFAKQAPKMIGELLGIKSGNMKLGLKDKLATGGGFVAGAAIGAGATTGVRNVASGLMNNWNKKDENGKTHRVRAVSGALLSGAAGTLSGAVRGGYAARGAKDYDAVVKAASKGASDATAARDYRDAHPMFEGTGDDRKFTGGTIGARVRNTGRSIAAWATGETTESLNKKNSTYSSIKDKGNSIYSAIKDDFEKNADKVILRNKDGKVVTDTNGNVVTLGQRKGNYEQLQEEYKNLKQQEWKDKYIAAGGLASNADNAFELYQSEFKRRVDAAHQIYDDALEDSIKSQYKFELNHDTKNAVKFKNGVNDVTVDASGNLNFDVGKINTINGVEQSIKDYQKLVDDNKTTISADINKILSNLQKEFVNTESEFDKDRINKEYKSLNAILHNIENPDDIAIKDFKDLFGAKDDVSLDSKYLRNSYGSLVDEVSNILRERKQKEEADKKKS